MGSRTSEGSALAARAVWLVIFAACLAYQSVATEFYIPSLGTPAGATKPFKLKGGAKSVSEVKQLQARKANGEVVLNDGVTTTTGYPEDEFYVSEEDQKSWQWDPFVRDKLQVWERITRTHVDAAQLLSRHAVTAFRARIINGHLYIEDIRALWFARQYTPSAKLTLLLTMKYFDLPDVDVVINQGDYPVVNFPKSAEHWRNKFTRDVMPPMFSPTGSGAALDLPWPDFSFMPPARQHELVTPRWDQARTSVLRASTKIAWEDKIDLAAWTGNTQAHPRQRMVKVANQTGSNIFVNSIFFKTDVGKLSCQEEGKGDKEGVNVNQCGMSFEEMCRYKYLINVGSNGYANKLKYLFLCNSTVLHVLDGNPSREFFEENLLAGVHYVAVRKVEDLPKAVAALKADPQFARQVAMAGTRRMRTLDMFQVTKYLATALTSYAEKMDYKPQLADTRKSFEVNCEDDLWRHYDLEGSLDRFLTWDNSTCLRLPDPSQGFQAPGYGGAYKGSGPSCSQANDLYELPDICNEEWKPGMLHMTKKGLMDWEPPPPK